MYKVKSECLGLLAFTVSVALYVYNKRIYVDMVTVFFSYTDTLNPNV